MRVLITLQEGWLREVYFPPPLVRTLEGIGGVIWNETGRPLTAGELARLLADVEVCVTHWGAPKFTAAVLAHAHSLRLIAHAAGSVGSLVTPAVYERGIAVCSANEVLARYVAEGTLAYILAGLRRVPAFDADLKGGKRWRTPTDELIPRSLFGRRVGLIGFGAVARHLLELLRPFGVSVLVFDPWVRALPAAYADWVQRATSLEEVLSWAEVLSVHASLTKDTYHMLDADRLALMPDGALLINTARGAIIEQAALERELVSGRLSAVLDVFEVEPLPLDSPLRGLDNVVLQPHLAGVPAGAAMTEAVVEDVLRFVRGEPLRHEISFERWRTMTRSEADVRRAIS